MVAVLSKTALCSSDERQEGPLCPPYFLKSKCDSYRTGGRGWINALRILPSQSECWLRPHCGFSLFSWSWFYQCGLSPMRVFSEISVKLLSFGLTSLTWLCLGDAVSLRAQAGFDFPVLLHAGICRPVLLLAFLFLLYHRIPSRIPDGRWIIPSVSFSSPVTHVHTPCAWFWDHPRSWVFSRLWNVVAMVSTSSLLVRAKLDDAGLVCS